MNTDSLLPLVDDMLTCRQRALDEVNALFYTDISVSLSSAWEDNQEQTDIVTDMLKDKLEDGGMGTDTDIERGEVMPNEETV